MSLSFASQIRLEEVAPYDFEHLLPEAGILYFFYDETGEYFGLNPTDHVGWKVLFYADGMARLQKIETLPSLPVTYNSCQIEFVSVLALPDEHTATEDLKNHYWDKTWLIFQCH